MCKYLVVSVLLLINCALYAQFAPPELTPSSRISMMTVSPGDELYSAFGHSAVRISDPSLSFDRVYNYGTFDFMQPNFYINFCRGKLLYMLDMEPYRSFERGNAYNKRIVREQVLDLTLAQKNRLFQALETNAREENRQYKYDFFYDNCATRIKDIVALSMDNQVVWEGLKLPEGTTMRGLLRPYLRYQPWTQFGIDLVLGMPTDRKATEAQAVFLPDFLHDAFKSAKTQDGKSLVSIEYCEPQFTTTPKTATPWWISPFFVVSIFVLLGVVALFFPKIARWYDPIFGVLLGIAGVIIGLLWFATDHGATKINLNLLWALPTHLLVFWRYRSQSKWVRYHTLLATVLAALVLVMWLFSPQEFPLPALPIVCLVVLKGLNYLRKR